MKQPPKSCNTMFELRAALDVLDSEIVQLLAKRSEFIDRAIDLKMAEGLPARIDDRVEYVAMRARENAEKVGLDPDLTESLWRKMIEWSIAREELVLGHKAEDLGDVE